MYTLLKYPPDVVDSVGCFFAFYAAARLAFFE
jgi:hypothetical protein